MIVDPPAAARSLAALFRWDAPVAMTAAAEGATGRVWRLETARASYAVKELYWAEDPVAEERTVARQILFCERARAAGVAAPADLRAASGAYVVALPPELGRRLVRASTWVEGRPVTSADHGAAAWAGRTQAVLEALVVPPGNQEVDPWSYRAPSEEAWDALAGRCKEAQKPWAARLRQVLPQLVALTALTGPPDPGALFVTHTDFQPQNVLVDSEGEFVLLDWDDAGPSTPARALAQLVNNWHVHGTTVDRAGIRRTLQGYRDAGGTTTLSDAADFGEAICGYLNYVRTQAELSLDESQDPALRLAADRQLPDLLQPPPVATYEEAVEATTSG